VKTVLCPLTTLTTQRSLYMKRAPNVFYRVYSGPGGPVLRTGPRPVASGNGTELVYGEVYPIDLYGPYSMSWENALFIGAWGIQPVGQSLAPVRE